ncbi:MAG: DUF4925 domain-containing protein [Bacteroidales bacterium]|nr:DUF4925 domain-containing protein [Bacteroidales bacterium]
MRKNLLSYLFVALCSIPLFTSCSNDDDDDNFVICPIGATEYTSASGLNLTYEGEPMLGKLVRFLPDAFDGTKAQLTLEGEPLDWSSLLSRADASVSTMASPGVFPGSTSVTIDVDLTINGDQCSFSGVSETDYCTFKYEGKVSAGSMDLSLSDVMLKNDALAATRWNLLPYDELDANNGPVHIVWTSEKGVEIFSGFELPIESVLKLALSMPLIGEGDDAKAAAQMLNAVLQNVTFRPNGNIVATYMDVANGSTSWERSPSNLAQYVVEADGQMRVFLNPQAIMAATSRAARAARENNVGGDMSAVLVQAIQAISRMVSEGVPLSYTRDADNMTVFLDEEVLLPLLKGIVVPLLQNEDFMNLIIEAIASDPSFGSMSGMVVGALQSLPEVINTTTELEIGLNLVKAQADLMHN